MAQRCWSPGGCENVRGDFLTMRSVHQGRNERLEGGGDNSTGPRDTATTTDVYREAGELEPGGKWRPRPTSNSIPPFHVRHLSGAGRLHKALFERARPGPFRVPISFRRTGTKGSSWRGLSSVADSSSGEFELYGCHTVVTLHNKSYRSGIQRDDDTHNK